MYRPTLAIAEELDGSDEGQIACKSCLFCLTQLVFKCECIHVHTVHVSYTITIKASNLCGVLQNVNDYSYVLCCSSKPTEAPPTSYQPTTTKATIELEGSSESGHGEGSGEEEEEDGGKTRQPACDETLINL